MYFLEDYYILKLRLVNKDIRLTFGNDPDSTQKLLDGLALRTEPWGTPMFEEGEIKGNCPKD